jgi:hypothetical protein
MTYTGIVLNLDNKADKVGDKFPPTCKVKFSKLTVPVVINFDSKTIVGTAHLRRRNFRIHYTIDLFPTGMIHPKLAGMLYPAVFGVITRKKKNKIIACEIKAISIQVNRNADKRIKRLTEA